MSRIVLSEINVLPNPEPPSPGTVALIFVNGTLYAWIGGQNQPLPITGSSENGRWTAQFQLDPQSNLFPSYPVALGAEIVAVAAHVSNNAFASGFTLALKIESGQTTELAYPLQYAANENGVKTYEYPSGNRPSAYDGFLITPEIQGGQGSADVTVVLTLGPNPPV